MTEDRRTLRIKVPKDLALEAPRLHEDIDLNVTQSVIVCLKQGIKTRKESAKDQQELQHGSDSTSNK